MDKLKILLGIVKGKPISRKLLVQILTSVLVFAGSYALQRAGLSTNVADKSAVSFAAAQLAGLAAGWIAKEWPSLLGVAPKAKPAKPVALAHVRIPVSAEPAARAPVVAPKPVAPIAPVKVSVPTPDALSLPEAAPAPKPVPHAWTEPVSQPDGQPSEVGPRTITG